MTETRFHDADLLKVLDVAIDLASTQLNREMKAAEGLCIEPGYFAGPRRQLVLLQELRGSLGGQSPSRADPAQNQILSRLSNAYSLSPRSLATRAGINLVFGHLNQAAFGRLRDDLKPHLLLHLSCAARLQKAHQSVASFAPFAPDEAHIIVVGSGNQPSDALIDYADGVLSLPTSDSYEGLVRKMTFACFVLSQAAPAATIGKFDDDVRLVDRSRFMAFWQRIERLNQAYLGFPVEPEHHATYWHGWHLGKCADPVNEDRGLCLPLPKCFANGGAGYFLKPPAVAALAYAFLTHQTFLDTCHGWAEDALIGLILGHSGITLATLGSGSELETGYTSQEAQRVLLEGASWQVFQERLADIVKEGSEIRCSDIVSDDDVA